MSIKSAKQFGLMESSANGSGIGPSPDVAKEFLNKTPRGVKSTFAKSLKKKKSKSKMMMDTDKDMM